MTTLKITFSLLFLSFLFLQTANSKDKNLSGNKAEELNTQLIQEIKETLQFPLLKFESKNLSGKVKVIASVGNDGKITFKDVKGINENLIANVIQKLNSLNLWASPDYAGKIFTYNISYKS